MGYIEAFFTMSLDSLSNTTTAKDISYKISNPEIIKKIMSPIP